VHIQPFHFFVVLGSSASLAESRALAAQWQGVSENQGLLHLQWLVHAGRHGSTAQQTVHVSDPGPRAPSAVARDSCQPGFVIERKTTLRTVLTVFFLELKENLALLLSGTTQLGIKVTSRN